MRKILVAGTALGALTAGVAQAQVQSGPGFFGSIDGLLALPPGKTSSMRTNNFPGEAGNANRGLGFGVDGQIGYAFGGGWDVAIGGGYLDYGKGKLQASGGSFRLTDGTMWRINADVGYTISGPGYGVRPFLGVQYINWRTKGVDPSNGYTHSGRTNAIGPEFGVDASLRITDSLSLFGGVDTAFLFGKVKDSVSLAVPGGKDSRLIWEIGAKAGIDWEMAPLWHLALGYKVAFWDGIQSKIAANAPAGVFTNAGGGRSGLIEHGPFIRIAYNWGAPPPGAAPMQPPPAGRKSYIVFFDFDRALITPTAATTIKQAATDAKAGKSTRLDVTGHADKSGGDAYNMALSLRRANAVKDALVREGIPAAQIAVVGRGESMPLVQTADGVREPQNRRVEIVIN